KVHQVSASRDSLTKQVQTFRSQVTQYARRYSGAPFDFKSAEAAPLKQTLTGLHKALVAPIEPDVAGKEVVAFIPSGSLLYMPFQALGREKPDGDMEFFIERHQVAILTKATDLDQVFGDPSPKNGALVALGNPDGTLAAATEEVKALQQIFPGSQVYIGAEATRERLNNVRAPQVAYLHLATHGTLDTREPLDSYLTMGQGSKLSVREIPQFQLDNPSQHVDMSLVTLSACQTALAEQNLDGSDVRSLADAFSYAGGRTLVASLWKVEDNSTRELMVQFYTGLKSGKTKAQALQEAQLSLLRQPRYRHPFFWAPFVMIGDWR
ncbi:MAG: CHAT domain-containing protein, partial [Candidatus Eremiobacterota bacterium]